MTVSILLLSLTLASCTTQEVAGVFGKSPSRVTAQDIKVANAAWPAWKRYLDVQLFLRIAWFNGLASQAAANSHHDDPFLRCTRAHESDTAGGYRAVSPGGLYRGAYQFLRSTWNNTASHMGRSDLVGVDPAAASGSDQDAVAWALYLWQGKAPWGNRC
jgi:hypothetical protein